MDSAIDGGVAVSMRGVSASRFGRAALRNVDWELLVGEIHAVTGEHSSGKSTLAGLISGDASPDSGNLLLWGRRMDAVTPRIAKRLGIGAVGQEPRLVGGMTVAENILLGGRQFHFFVGRRMIADALLPLTRLGADMPPTARLRDLPADRQRIVELAKAIVGDPKILILDEVSGRFNPEEMEKVYALMREWREMGRSVLFVCRTLDEALEFADRVTFLSGGVVLGTEEAARLDRHRILTFTAPSLASRENLRKANIELYNYKRYNESLIQNLPIGVVIIDPDRRVHLANSAALRLLDAGPAGLPGLDAEAALTPEIVALVDRAFSAAATAEEEMEVMGTPVRATAFPFRDGDGDVLGSVALLEDIAAEERMKGYLMRMERLRSAAELAAGVAHEINNPLCVIRNYVELLKRQPGSPEAPKRLEKIGAELDWIVEIVGGMLSFARPVDGPHTELDLRTVIGNAAGLMGYRFREKATRLDIDVPDAPVQVTGNESRLKQLFVNLLANAADAVPGTNGVVRIVVGTPSGGDYVEARIEDNGPGIPAEAGDRIFDPFFTTKATRHNTGLGLSICQQIVDLHHGLLLASRTEGWTVFSIRLPARGENVPGRDGGTCKQLHVS